MRRQVDVGGSTWLGRVDFCDPQLPLIVQIDSERYHSALIDRQADQRQQAELEAAGFEVLRVTDEQVWQRPEEVIGAVRNARHSVRARLARRKRRD